MRSLVPRLTALVELAKLRITAMVMFTAAVGFVTAIPTDRSLGTVTLGWTLLGTGLVAAGAGALNMLLERRTDGLMLRTRSRPLPSGRLSAAQALGFGLLLSLSGWVVLSLLARPLAALVSWLSWMLYLGVYTPLKTRTPWAVYVGSVSGAAPPLIGWAAFRGRLDAPALVPFGLMFFWQIPHFLAIARVYRDDYSRGHLRAWPVIDPGGAQAARQAFFSSLAAVAVSLAPVVSGHAGSSYVITALALGALLIAFAVRFARTDAARTARALFLVSLPYLVLVLTALVLARREWL